MARYPKDLDAEDAGRLRRLKARFRDRGIAPEPWLGAERAGECAQDDGALRRLGAFTPAHVERGKASLGAIRAAPWPEIDGCLGLVFTSRSGSSLLCQELASRYRIGDMGESLNPHMVQGIAAANIVRAHADNWFSFKLGLPGVISAELTGVVSQYIARTHFLFLLRRDVVAQAVSLVKARQRGQWLSTHRPTGSTPSYDAGEIAAAIRIIVRALGHLRSYLELTERPWRRLVYEDFERGDYASALTACDEFGVPRRPPGELSARPALEKMSDGVNEDWMVRFREEMDSPIRDCIANYAAAFF